MRVIYLEPARRDLERLRDFLCDGGVSRERANRIVSTIVAGVRILENNPHVGFSFGGKYGFTTPYRGLVVGTYIVVYEVLAKQVEVRRIYSGRENYLQELSRGGS
ncbi:MAG: type II toxin-antitoxin system RelE/ParE family toxin [Coriobacteriales bacterium]|jgi:plasmid stabilization system protein ParE|nr:type II toxin-antitoxin system RelE/ParE family toxin [Coriobacteriales bacterium]